MRCSFLFRFQIIRISALILLQMSVSVKLKNPIYHIIQKVAVMGNRDHNPLKGIQIIFQNRQCRNIQIVSRFIDQKQIDILCQNPQKIQSSFLSSRQFPDRRILHIRSKQKPLQKLRCADSAISGDNIFADLFDIVNDSLAVIHLLFFLCKISDLDSLSHFDRPGIRLNQPRHHFDQGRFSTAVWSDDSKLLIFEYCIRKISDQYLFPI